MLDPTRVLHVSLTTVIAAATVSACDKSPIEAPNPRSLAASQTLAPVRLPVGGHEATWAQYARDVPGFGGMYYDSTGTLVIVLADTSRSELAVQHFSNRIGQSHRPPEARSAVNSGKLVIRQGRFDYLELLAIKDSVWRRVSGLAGVVSVAINEVENDVEVGMRDAAGLAEVGPRLSGLIVATAIMREPIATVFDTVSLGVFSTPLVGGQRILTRGTFCTLGLPVWYTLLGSSTIYSGALTAEHCLDTVNARISMTDSITGSFIDVGRVEFQGATNTFGCGTNTCRWADAGLIQLENSGLNYIKGSIAETATSSDTGMASTYMLRPSTYTGTSLGPLLVDLDATPGGEVVGQWVEKVGVRLTRFNGHGFKSVYAALRSRSSYAAGLT